MDSQDATARELPLFYHVRLRPASEEAVLGDDMRERFRQVVEQIAGREGFEVVVMSAGANFVQFILGNLGARDLDALVSTIKQETARGILAGWPMLAHFAPEGDFWDEGFLYTCHNAATIEAALDYIKRHGDVDLFGPPDAP
ncbi:MAG: transposase [Anaerolineae bacterium]|nr:transposase [Anaerolineae bacterium]